MDANELMGLLGAVGKSLAVHGHGRNASRDLEALPDAAAFREFLEARDLGISEPSRSRFVDAVTGDGWEDWRSRLAAAANVAWHDFTAPSA